MRRKVLVVYPHKCTGCRICEQWCAQTHDGRMNPAKARLAIHRIHHLQVNVPVACSQCAKPPCIEVCPSQCIRRDDRTLGLLLDAEACIGCRMCVDRCVRGAIKMDADAEVPLLCDLCGGDPQCVRRCPEGAIEYVPLDRADRGVRQHHAVCLVEAQEAQGGAR